jgi:long-chain acyl-CoA synthetase
MGFVCVPLYDTLGENAIEYIIDHSESSFLVLSAAKLPDFAKALPKVKVTLKGVVYWGKDPSQEALSAVQAAGSQLLRFSWLVNRV